MPEDVEKYEVHQEKHYSVPELAKLWNVSKDAIRRVFADEPGVLILPSATGNKITAVAMQPVSFLKA